MGTFREDKRELRRIRRLMVRTKFRLKHLERYTARENEVVEIEKLKTLAHKAVGAISRGGLSKVEKFNRKWARSLCWCLIHEVAEILDQVKATGGSVEEQLRQRHMLMLKFVVREINFLSSDLSDGELKLTNEDLLTALVESEVLSKVDGSVKGAEQAMATLLRYSERHVGQNWKPRAQEFFRERVKPILVNGIPLMPPLPDTRARGGNVGLAKAMKLKKKSLKK